MRWIRSINTLSESILSEGVWLLYNWFSLETFPHKTSFGTFSRGPLEPSHRPPGRSWTSIWELVPCHHQHLLFSNQRSSKERSLERTLILCGPIRSLPCLLFPGSSKVLTNDRWQNVETTADNKSTLDEKQPGDARTYRKQVD